LYLPDRIEAPPTQVAISDILTPEFEAFMDYWNSLRVGAFAPSWKQFDLVALNPKSIPRLVVVDVHHGPFDVVVRFWGTGHVQRKGFDKTGTSIAGMPTVRGPVAFSEYRWVVENRQPFASRDTVNLLDAVGKPPFHQTLIRLPLSNDGERVDHIVSLASWERV